jgi:hypothetical protein
MLLRGRARERAGRCAAAGAVAPLPPRRSAHRQSVHPHRSSSALSRLSTALRHPVSWTLSIATHCLDVDELAIACLACHFVMLNWSSAALSWTLTRVDKLLFGMSAIGRLGRNALYKLAG